MLAPLELLRSPLWPCARPRQSCRKIKEYDKRALIRPVYGIYYFIYTRTCEVLQSTFPFVLMLFLYVVKWNRRGSLIGHKGTERQGAALSSSLEHKRIDFWTQRKQSEGNSVKCILSFSCFHPSFSQEANAKNRPHLNLRVIHTTQGFLEFNWMATLSPEEHSWEEPENRTLHLVTALV